MPRDQFQTHTTDADGKFLYGSPEEKAGRSTRGEAGSPTESHFAQIRPSTSGGRSGITGKKPGRAHNGRYGKNLRG